MNLLGKRVDYRPEEYKIFAASKTIGFTVLLCGIGGISFIAMWANGVIARPPEGQPAIGLYVFLGADLLVAAAAAAAGGLFGFIFGIPRTLEPASAVATAATLAGPAAASKAVMAANTNLERISDWLTTLLIGATLVQIKEIAGWVGSLGKSLIGTGPAANDAVVPIIVIYFFALSFMGVYLITRLYLTFAFRQALGGRGDDSASDLGGLKQKLDAAIESGKTEDLKAAMAAYDGMSLSMREDAELYGKVARILAKQIADGTATGRVGDPAVELKNAVVKAAADPEIKKQLKDEFARINTKNAELDTEIKNTLA